MLVGDNVQIRNGFIQGVLKYIILTQNRVCSKMRRLKLVKMKMKLYVHSFLYIYVILSY